MIVKKQYSVKEVFDAMDAAHKVYPSRQFNFDGDTKGMRFNSARMLNFRNHGIVCKHCGLEGKFFRKEKHSKEIRTWHLNLYAICPTVGRPVLMTRDHIIPTARGGPNTLENSQTLCTWCNCSKGSRLPHEYVPQLDYKKQTDRMRNQQRRLRRGLTWNLWKRRVKYFVVMLKRGEIVWPSRHGSQDPDITSFWKY